MSRPGTEILWEQGLADVLKQIKIHLRGWVCVSLGLIAFVKRLQYRILSGVEKGFRVAL